MGNNAWWTLRGANSDQIINVNISPFYAQISALGVNPTIPLASVLGAVTRLLLTGTALVLVLSGLWPTAWWRRLGLWFSLTSLVEAYFSLALLIHLAQVTLLATYGATAPILGTANLSASILGLDLALYQNPALSAAFTLDFFLGLVSLTLLSGGQFYNFLHNRERVLITSGLTKGVKEVHLTPPYHHAWVSTSDKALNPLSRDPDQLTDDELAVSFQGLNKQLQPGGALSIILPAWASTLGGRLLKLVPWTGFQVEKSDLIYRTAGKPENELVFRKPIVKETLTETETPQKIEVGSMEIEVPPIVEPQEEPTWAEPRLTRQERAMLKSATSVIERRREPVPYKELLNEVYMDLLDRKVEFESARQIENTLLKHTGKELAIIEEVDQATARVVRKWWLGDQGLEQEEGQPLNLWKRISRKVKPGLPSVHQVLNKWQRQRKESKYKPKRHRDEDEP